MNNFSAVNRANFFQNQTESIWNQWEYFKEELEDTEGAYVLVDWDIYDVWDAWLDVVEIDRNQADCFNPSLLPGKQDSFAAFKKYCQLKDPAFYADEHNGMYLEWLNKNPEEFFSLLYVFNDKPPENRHDPRYGEWSMQDVVRAINTRDARTYIHAMQACKLDLYELSGTPITFRKEFVSITPYGFYAARTARLINCYGGFEWKNDAMKKSGQYADMYEHLPVLQEDNGQYKLIHSVPSRSVAGEVCECLACGAWTNETLQECISKEEANDLIKGVQSKKTKRQIINHSISTKAANRLKLERAAKEEARNKRRSIRRDKYAERKQKIEDYEEKIEDQCQDALVYLGVTDIVNYSDTDIFEAIKRTLLFKPGVKKVKKQLLLIVKRWKYLGESTLEDLKQLLHQYEETFQN